MTFPKPMDRRNFLTSSLASLAGVSLVGCGGDTETGGTAGPGPAGTDTGGTNMVASGGGNANGANMANNMDTGGQAGSANGANAGSDMDAGANAASDTDAGGNANGANASNDMDAGTSNGSANGAGGDDGGTAGMNESGGGTYVCGAETDNGDHSHPLTIPGSDVERGYQAAPYLLEDGGTGHTHTLELSAYEFFYLKAGVMTTVESSVTNDHSHLCVITCTPA